MFDANLCGTPEGYNIWVKFHGSAGKFGDTTNIIAGKYKCRVINPCDDNQAMSIEVYEPRLRNQSGHGESVMMVHYADVGNRWVTYEGHVWEHDNDPCT